MVDQPPVPEPSPDPLVAKLVETLSAQQDQGVPDPAPFGTPAYAQLMLTAIPIQQLADSLNKRYLAGTRRVITQLAAGTDWDPADWVVACSPYLFHGWEEIDHVQVMHTNPLPWSVLLVRSPEWFARTCPFAHKPGLQLPNETLANKAAAEWARLKQRVSQYPAPPAGPWFDPDAIRPSDFVRITGV